MSRTAQFTNDEGNTFTVRIVYDGEPYGREMVLTHYEHDPLIEFYDADYDFAKDENGKVLGQFVSRYYKSTLNTPPHDRGLNLQGDVPKWGIDANTLTKILDWINA